MLNNLESIQKGGYAIAIMPISCVNDTTGRNFQLKKILMENHTIDAVLSMPEELFHNSRAHMRAPFAGAFAGPIDGTRNQI